MALPSHELSLIVRRANAVIELDIEGTEEMVLVKDVQRDPVSSVIEHVDLVIVLKGEKVEVEVPLHLEGEALAPAVANLDVTHLLVKVPATDIPEHFVINVEGLEEGNHITAANVSLPDDVELITEPETVVVTVAVPALEEEPEAETATEEAPAEDAPAAEE